MRIALVKYASIDVETQLRFIISLSNELDSFFAEKNYGEDVKEIIIGIICVSKDFESFFNLRKPRYIRDKKVVKSKDTKQEYEVEKCLEYDIKLDYRSVIIASDAEIVKIISNEILNSLNIIDTMKKKIKDFDTKKFREDFELFFREKI